MGIYDGTGAKFRPLLKTDVCWQMRVLLEIFITVLSLFSLTIAGLEELAKVLNLF